jgi:HK97 family phage major capsid protein
MTAAHVGEAATTSYTDPTYDKVMLTARKVMALGKFSSEVNEDSAISIANELAMEAALAIATRQDEDCFNGDGTSTYGRIVGLKNALTTGSEYTAATGNTGFGTLDLDDFEGMMAKLPSYAYRAGNVKWFIHRTGWALSMQRLAAAAGGNTVSNLTGGVPQQLFLGYPIEFVEVMNSTIGAQASTEGLCYFGDLAMAGMFGNRRGIAVAVSDHVAFATDETVMRWTTRYDVNIHDVGVTSGAAGAIVQLLTPGS